MAKVDFNHEKMMEPAKEKEKRLIAIGLQMQEEIKNSMKKSGTGKIYMRGKNKDIIHQASSPGEPPATDTGRLRDSISTNWTDSGMGRGVVGSKATANDGVGVIVSNDSEFHVCVGTNVEYAPFLEFGTRRMAARPFVRPIFDLFSSKVPELMKSGNIFRNYKE